MRLKVFILNFIFLSILINKKTEDGSRWALSVRLFLLALLGWFWVLLHTSQFLFRSKSQTAVCLLLLSWIKCSWKYVSVNYIICFLILVLLKNFKISLISLPVLQKSSWRDFCFDSIAEVLHRQHFINTENLFDEDGSQPQRYFSCIFQFKHKLDYIKRVVGSVKFNFQYFISNITWKILWASAKIKQNTQSDEVL